MSLIGTLTTGAGVQTNIVGQKKLDMFLLIGDVDTANPLQGLIVEVDGVTYFQVGNAATLLTAFAKWQEEMTGSIVGVMFKIATGAMEANVNYRLTNAGATTPNIYAFSEVDDGVPFYVSTDTVNLSSSSTYDNFSALFLQTPANILSVEIEFWKDPDNHDLGTYRETMLIQEVDAYFALYNNAETDGRLGGVSVIDNSEQKIAQVKINTNATGACTILQAKLPDEAFKMLKRAGKF